jgi:hypothetical protein
VKAFLSKRAARAADRIAVRWRAHADDPDVFARELLEVIDSPFPTMKHPALKRMLLKKSGCHLYFEIDEPRQRIQILHVWDSRRARPPKL